MLSFIFGVFVVVFLDCRDKKYVLVIFIFGLIILDICWELGLNNKLLYLLIFWRKLVCYINEFVRMIRI